MLRISGWHKLAGLIAVETASAEILNKLILDMSKYLVILLPVVLCMIHCGARTPVQPKAIGIGLLTMNTDFEIPLYKQEVDSVPFDVLRFKMNKSGVMKFVSDIKLKPYRMTGGDSFAEGERNINMGLIRFAPELKFRVIDTTATSFKVVTNEETWEIMLIKRDATAVYYSTERELSDNSCSNCAGSKYNPRWYIYETWERYLKRVEFITRENVVVYDQPNGKVAFENKENIFLPFRVMELKGEWIRLGKGFGRESEFDSLINAEGWIKWREGPVLSIDITEHTYE